MNKNINIPHSNFQVKREALPKHEKNRHFLFPDQQPKEDPHNSSSQYLETEISSLHHSPWQKHSQHPHGLRPRIILKDTESIPDKKRNLKKKKKRLIIEDQQKSELHKNSVSITLEKKHAQTEEHQLRTFSSEKKTPLKEVFQSCSPPKKSSKASKAYPESRIEEDNKCQLIKSILKRYKDHFNTNERPDVCQSPCISSLKLKQRAVLPTNYTQQCNHIKFFGKRGCPPTKLSKQFVIRRQHHQNKSQHLAGQKSREYIVEEISPWRTEEHA